MRAVVVGGGTGSPMSIKALLALGAETSAVVAMADDGGSTGMLREEANVTPPGDIRKCIAAFARNPQSPWVQAFCARLPVARNHALGNLLLATLEDACGSFPEAIALCEALVQAQGHVYPSTLDHVTLEAQTFDGRIIGGQALACHSKTALQRVRLISSYDCPIDPYQPALDALRAADLIVLGPGSLFTSIIPNLCVPGVVQAIRQSNAHVLFVCSLADSQGETWGLSAREHLQALYDHGLEGAIDYMLVHTTTPLRPDSLAFSSFTAMTGDVSQSATTAGLNDVELSGDVRPVPIDYQDVLAIQATGVTVIARNLVHEKYATWHSVEALTSAFEDVIKLSRARGSAASTAA